MRLKISLQDDKPDLSFNVNVPNYPFFHPADSTLISEVIGASNCKIYAVFNQEDGVWTITELAQKVKPNDVLPLRSRDVTCCPGVDMGRRPVAGQKRRLTMESEQQMHVRIKRKGTDVIEISSDDELRHFFSLRSLKANIVSTIGIYTHNT